MTAPAYDRQSIQMIAPGAAAAFTTSASAYIDMDDAAHATILVNISTNKNTNAAGVTMSLRHSDATVYSNAVTLVADVVHVGHTVTTAEGQYTYHVDQRGKKRYLFLSVTPDTTTNGNVNYSASAIKSRLKQGASSTTGMTDDTTHDGVTII